MTNEPKTEYELWSEFIYSDIIEDENERKIRLEMGNDEYYALRIKQGYKFNNKQIGLFD